MMQLSDFVTINEEFLKGNESSASGFSSTLKLLSKYRNGYLDIICVPGIVALGETKRRTRNGFLLSSLKSGNENCINMSSTG